MEAILKCTDVKNFAGLSNASRSAANAFLERGLKHEQTELMSWLDSLRI